MNRSVLTSFAAGAVVLWAGCATMFDPVSPDTSNKEVTIDASSAGQLAYAQIAQTEQISTVLSQSTTATALLSSPSMDALAQGTAKRQSLVEGTWEIDTMGDTIRITAHEQGLLKIKDDTLDIRLDAMAGIEGSQNIIQVRGSATSTNGKTEYYAITDLDGDGVVNGDPQYAGKAKWAAQTIYANDVIGHKAGEVEYLEFQVNAGADRDFDTEDDNVIYTAFWVKTINDDTVAYARFTDADGDGIIAGSGIASVIDVEVYDSNNPSRPFVESGKLFIRVDRAADGTEKTVRIAAEEKLVTGRVNRVYVVDENGDSTISEGELAYLHLTTTSPFAADTEVTAEVLFVVDPGADLCNELDNLLHELHVTREYRLGLEKHVEFHFVADPPVPHGQDPTGGTFELSVEYVNGKNASLVGSFKQGLLDATYTDPDGVATHVTITQSGEVVPQS